MKKVTELDETPIRLSQLTILKKMADDYSHLEEDYILTKITSANTRFEDPVARRFDGLTMFISVKGTLKVTINLSEITVEPNSILFIPPDTVFKPLGWEGEELEAYLLFLSTHFINDLNIDLNTISTSLFTNNNLLMQLTSSQLSLLMRYFDLLHVNALEKNNYNRNIARSLASAACYQMMALGEEAANQTVTRHPQARKLTYALTFLRLVRDYHRVHRSIGFYAGKMFISPKYLSLIIKEATGKSAAEWIDQYVLQEAKNLLRYSGKNVQQIAYELNFSNQSSFGKYFKHLTGMSPTKFQNSL